MPTLSALVRRYEYTLQVRLHDNPLQTWLRHGCLRARQSAPSQRARRCLQTRAIQRMPRIHSHTTYHWHRWSVDTTLGRCRGRLLLLHHLHFIVCRHFCDSGPSIRDRDVSCSPVTSFFATPDHGQRGSEWRSQWQERAQVAKTSRSLGE